MEPLRRLYERLRQTAQAEHLHGAASVLLGMRDALPGTAFPTDFPAVAALERAGYFAVEDLAGADLAELLRAGLTGAEAEAVSARLRDEA